MQTLRNMDPLGQNLQGMFVLALPWMAGSAASTPNPDSYWRASPPIKYTDTVNAGWSQISNATDLLVYNGVAENRTYAHHPELYYSVKTKTVYLIHSSAPIDEDSMGQDIWITVSHDDGQSWTPPHPILPAALLSNQTNTYNFTYWCDASIWQRALQALTVVEVNGVVYTIGQTTDFYCWGDIGSGSKAAGRIARAVTSSGTEADDPCWLSMNNWTEVHLFNETVYGTEYGMKFCQDKDAINALIAEPDEVPAWGDWLYNHDLHAADGVHYMQENTHAVWIVDDSSITGGYWQRFWRDITATNNTQSVWVETTISIRGADWYPHVREEYGNKIFQTNIPDAKTKQFLGVLSGSGDRYFVSNSRNNSELIRQPLTIALSRGADLSYTNIGVLRTGADPFPAPDTRDYKNVGFSYPTAVQVGNSLIVSYSEDKQNIWVTYVDISDLP